MRPSLPPYLPPFLTLSILLMVCRVRELTTGKVGTLLRVSGQVVRTHPVHPELVSASFLCLECQTRIPDVEQQFKYTQVPSAPARRSTSQPDPLLANCVQESYLSQQEAFPVGNELLSLCGLPEGEGPRDAAGAASREHSTKARPSAMSRSMYTWVGFSLEVILRAEMVEAAQAGDKCDFTGTLVVVPDVSQLRTEGGCSSLDLRDLWPCRNEGGDVHSREGSRGLRCRGSQVCVCVWASTNGSIGMQWAQGTRCT